MINANMALKTLLINVNKLRYPIQIFNSTKNVIKEINKKNI